MSFESRNLDCTCSKRKYKVTQACEMGIFNSAGMFKLLKMSVLRAMYVFQYEVRY